MRHISFLFSASCLLFASNFVAAELPRFTELIPKIEFWKKTYGTWTEDEVAIYDRENMDVVYRVVKMPDFFSDLSLAQKEPYVEDLFAELRVILEKLDRLRPTSPDNLSPAEREVFLNVAQINRANKFSASERLGAKSGLKERFAMAISKSGAYADEIKQRFAAAGLPEDLIGIIFVESMFVNEAVSKAGAAGMWQFMPSTGKGYLHINRLVDERFDPMLATDAAIEYLSDAQESFGQWPFAITSYNLGKAGMRRAINAVGSNDFITVLHTYDGDRFGFAVKNYYAEVIAALEIYKNSTQFFNGVNLELPKRYEFVITDSVYRIPDLMRVGAIAEPWFSDLNPSLTRYSRNGSEVLPEGFHIRVPLGFTDKFLRATNSISDLAKRKAAYTLRARHKATGHETLAKIAKAYDIVVETLSERLRIIPSHKIKRGKIVELRSADSRFSPLPKPMFNPEKSVASN